MNCCLHLTLKEPEVIAKYLQGFVDTTKPSHCCRHQIEPATQTLTRMHSHAQVHTHAHLEDTELLIQVCLKIEILNVWDLFE